MEIRYPLKYQNCCWDLEIRIGNSYSIYIPSDRGIFDDEVFNDKGYMATTSENKFNYLTPYRQRVKGKE